MKIKLFLILMILNYIHKLLLQRSENEENPSCPIKFTKPAIYFKLG